MTLETPRSDTQALGKDPWIESREGMSFFANALLVFPQISVFFPLLLGRGLRFLGIAEGLQEILAVIPDLASRILPFAGVLFVLPLWFALRIRRETQRPSARFWLLVFALAHASFVLYALSVWLGAFMGGTGPGVASGSPV